MRRLLLLAAGLALAACRDTQQGVTAGDLLVSYFQGGSEAGALLLTISGGPVDNVTSLGGQQVSFASPQAGTTRVIVTGTLVNGDLLRIQVPDLSRSASYSVRAEQVADKTSFALMDPSRYTFTVHK